MYVNFQTCYINLVVADVLILTFPASAVVKRKKPGHIETIMIKVDIHIEKVDVEFANEERSLAIVGISGLKSNLSMKESYTHVNVTLQDIKVIDQNPNTIHTEVF